MPVKRRPFEWQQGTIWEFVSSSIQYFPVAVVCQFNSKPKNPPPDWKTNGVPPHRLTGTWTAPTVLLPKKNDMPLCRMMPQSMETNGDTARNWKFRSAIAYEFAGDSSW
jgi:hypothetical protein